MTSQVLRLLCGHGIGTVGDLRWPSLQTIGRHGLSLLDAGCTGQSHDTQIASCSGDGRRRGVCRLCDLLCPDEVLWIENVN
jgi:hypothetical protein